MIEQNQVYYSSKRDRSYLYLFISKGYLMKIGIGYNNTIMGKVFLSKENYRTGERRMITIGELYYNQLSNY